MKTGKSLAIVLMLLLSAGVMAEGGKQRGDEGQGNVVQDQIRVIEPPAQWSASSIQPVDESDSERETDIQEEELDEQF